MYTVEWLRKIKAQLFPDSPYQLIVRKSLLSHQNVS